MEDGQQLFFNYILECVTESKKEATEQLLKNAFQAQQAGKFDRKALEEFNQTLLSMIKPEYHSEVSKVLSESGEQHIDDSAI